MKQFFKFTFASCLGSFLALIAIVFFIFFIIGGLISSVSQPDVEVKDNSILVIKMDKPIYDREVESIQEIFSTTGLNMESNIGLTEFIAVINKAKTDKRIKAIMLDFSILQANGIATAQEIREVLQDFQKSGKKVYSYGDLMDQKSYYIASATDKIMINPAGEVLLSGMGAEVMYIKDLINKFDIDVDLVRPKSNAFKSAGEMYINNKMSDSNRVQTRQYLSSIWDVISLQMSESRNINIDTFNSIVSSLQGFMPKDALQNHIIDYIGFKSDFKEMIADNVVKENSLSKKSKVNFISYSKYRKSFASLQKVEKENIAVVYAYGNVTQGKGSDLSIGSETTCKAIEKAVKDKRVKAIVLRVNSPGGDAIASESITNEVIKAKKKKPVIISMGDYAASAGYEMSSNASYIVANPTTITGSIGVFGVMPNFSRALKTHLGISFDTVKTHQNSNPLSVTTPMTSDAKALMQRNVEQFYINFINRVATGRNRTPEYISTIAKGRVWTGADAKGLGLIDEFGGLNKAIQIAAKKAGLKQYGIISYPKTKGLLEQIMDTESKELSLKAFTKELGKPYSFFLQLRDISNMQGVQKRMDYILSF
ncbi:MAG: signal peptide peptidase SppA [Bacteroidales bacterium]|nr:signal peptide peptidase SppA [Bacteroidales bacterium]